LTDGVVLLRAFELSDVDVRLLHDEEMARRFGWWPVVVPSAELMATAIRDWHADWAADRRVAAYLVTRAADGLPVGFCDVKQRRGGRGVLSWATFAPFRRQGYATRAVRLLCTYAFTDLGLARLEAYVDVGNTASLRVAYGCGLRREGVLRGRETLLGERRDEVVHGRLATDPDPAVDIGPTFFASLPRKRVTAGLVVRDEQGRVLLVEPTYKDVWEVPGGSVEADESPAAAVRRESLEELGLTLGPGALRCVDWLPAGDGHTEGLHLLFDGGVLGPADIARIRLPADELRSYRFCTPDDARTLLSARMFRRLEAALTGTTGASYLEAGHPPDTG
jgi:RimJ/RimL family protein N-acetyltransferase/8-oxo-dGTP pyrophosphatase MutT (NUDIX family)